MDLSDRLLQLAHVRPYAGEEVAYRGSILPRATLSSSDEKVLRRAQKIMERLRVDTSPIKEAILKYGM